MTKVSPGKTPQVVGKLFDLRANEDFTKRILIAVATACPVEEMVEIAETMKRRRIKWANELTSRVKELCPQKSWQTAWRKEKPWSTIAKLTRGLR